MPSCGVGADVDHVIHTDPVEFVLDDMYLESAGNDLPVFGESPQENASDDVLQNFISIYTENSDFKNAEQNSPPENDISEIYSSLNDWEDYMYCKEHEVLTKYPGNSGEVPEIRCYHVIRYPIAIQTDDDTFTCSKTDVQSNEDSSCKLTKEEVEKARGNKAFKAGNFVQACLHYSNAIAAAPSVSCYNNRAQANLKLKNYKAAMKDLQEVLVREPNNTKALYRRVTCRMNLRMFQEALFDLQIILDSNPNNAECLSHLASAKHEISLLNGRKYRMRNLHEPKNTFDVDSSQLAAYVDYGDSYIVEADGSGCAKSCVCGFCTAEDACSRRRTNGLRIRERCRWRHVTADLLAELRIEAPKASSTTTTPPPAATDAESDNCAQVAAAAGGDQESKNESAELVENAVGARRKMTSSTPTAGRPITPPAAVAAAAAAGFPAAVGSPTKSTTDAEETRRRSLECVENAIRALQLEYSPARSDAVDFLKNTPPETLKERFDCRLDDQTFRNLIHSVCAKYQPENDWPLMSRYLSEITRLDRFRVFFTFLDIATKRELFLVFRKAINMNLKDADRLRKFYS